MHEFSVSELALSIKTTIEATYGRIKVKGEISQPKRHSSGHVYLRLKDDSAIIEAICWKGIALKFSSFIQEGAEVICTGKITTYPGRSQYQMIIEHVEPAGIGALMKMLEELKQKLLQEGLFDQSRKKPRPFLPKKIGIITSPTGAVIKDILHRLQDRFPLPVLLWPVAVQGEGAYAQIVAAIKGMNALDETARPDLLILARGGGSFEDLMPFNHEDVVRAIAESKIPLISAIGHETDTTLSDFAADLRAPTPTAAAELAVPVKQDLILYLMEVKKRLYHTVKQFLTLEKNKLEKSDKSLLSPRSLLDLYNQKLDDRTDRLRIALTNIRQKSLERHKNLNEKLDRQIAYIVQSNAQFLKEKSALLESYSFERTLDRGFAMVTTKDHHVVSNIKKITANQEFVLRLKDGECIIQKSPQTQKSSSPFKKENYEQGALF